MPHPNPLLCTIGVAATLLAGPLSAADLAVDVRPDGYLWAGERIGDADRLAALLLPRTPRSVALRACGADAAPALKAAAHRFRHLALELSVDAAACPVPVVASLAPGGLALGRPADVAAEAWWAQLAP